MPMDASCLRRTDSDNSVGSQRTIRWISRENYHTRLICLISVVFFIFAALRAVYVPFTHDESFSYLEFVDSHSLKEVLLNPADSAGNHLLNTVLMKILALVFPPEVWILRLPNLFAYVLFLYASFRVCQHLFEPVNQIAAFILLNLNMFLLQFFSLARGYGLALSFMMASLWFFMQFLDSNRPLWHAGALGAAALACFANLSFLNYYCALLLISAVIHFRAWVRIEPRPKFLQWCVSGILSFWDGILTFGILAGTVIPFAMKLRELNRFYYGGNEGFVDDTVFTLMQAYLLGVFVPERFLPIALSWAPAILGLLLGIYVAVTLFAGLNPRNAKASALYWILFVSAAATVIQHHLLGTLYLHDRAALFLMPSFVLCIAWIVAWEGKPVRILMQLKTGLLFMAIISLIGWHFSRVANIRYAVPWKYDADTIVMLNDLQAARKADGKTHSIRLGVSVPLYASISFYSKTKGLDWLEKVDRSGIKNRDFDYYYLLSEDFDYARSIKATLLKEYPLDKTRLMRAPVAARPERPNSGRRCPSIN